MKLRTKLRIAIRHLRSRPFQTCSVILIVAFSAGLAVALFVLAQGLRLGLVRAVEPFELIIGAKGSPYQLVLNTVFLQDAPVGNISWEDYAELSGDARVGSAAPLGFGDSYRGYPVVGATSEILKIRVKASSPPWLGVAEGRWFGGEFEAVLGARAASETGLRVGDKFRTSHGVIANGDEHDGDFRVVGIAKTTRGPYDRAIFVPLETIWEEHGHSGVTAILVHPRSYSDAYSLAVSFQHSPDMQLIFPAQTAIRLFSLMGRGEAFLSVIVYAVGLCALATAMLVLYWSGAARRGERALLHVIGVTRGALIFISWLEGTLTLLAGVALGELLGRLGAVFAFAALGNATAIDSSVPMTPRELIAPLILLAAASLGSLFAAWRDRF